MLARMSSSLTAEGPTCLISMRAILTAEIWARLLIPRTQSRPRARRRNRNFIVARSIRHVLFAYFCALAKRLADFRSVKFKQLVGPVRPWVGSREFGAASSSAAGFTIIIIPAARFV